MNFVTKETNTEFLNRVMDSSRFGAMTQLVVLHAIGHYCEQAMKNRAAVLKEMENSPFSGPAWMAAVEDLKKQLDAHLDFKTDRPVAGMRRSA